MATSALLLLTGCNVFDLPPTEISNRCTDPTVPRASSSESFEVVTEGLGDQYDVMCGVESLDGPDGFFAVDIAEGERWFVHAEPVESNYDIAIYGMTSTCEAQTCMAAADACGPGAYEQLVLAPASPGRYMIGIDGRQTGGLVMVTTARQTCGDGELQPGEACDGGDDCVDCRVVLSSTDEVEREPNHGDGQANVLAATGAAQMVRGVIGNRCDIDTYAVQVSGGGLEVLMLNPAERPCSDGALEIEMWVTDASGTIVGRGQSGRAGGDCPTIELGDSFADELVAGEYHVWLAASGHPRAFAYSLRVTAPRID